MGGSGKTTLAHRFLEEIGKHHKYGLRDLHKQLPRDVVGGKILVWMEC
ncbi:hypothetical protein Hanom_Chr09g00772541 [Helianthus anomalus]